MKPYQTDVGNVGHEHSQSIFEIGNRSRSILVACHEDYKRLVQHQKPLLSLLAKLVLLQY